MDTNRQEDSAYSLICDETRVGSIVDVEADFPWMVGRIELTDAGQRFVPFLLSLTDESREQTDEHDFPGQWRVESHWHVTDEGGNLRGISFPALHDDMTIYWRWR